jgi:signal transduction histidine kinase
MTAKPGAASGTVGLVVLTAVVLYATTDNHGVAVACYLSVLVGAAAGAWIGAERAPQGRRLVPRLIATGLSLTALGDVLWNGLDLMGGETDVSIADPPFLASYVVLCAALCTVLARSRSRNGNRVDVDFLVDALTIVVVSVLIIWTTSINAIIADDSVPPFVRAVWAAYPLADAVLLALVVRVLMSRSARASFHVSFAVGVCLWLTADLLYLRGTENGAAALVMDAAWMVGPVLMARSAWLDRDAPADKEDSSALGGWALAVAVGPLFVPPTLELLADLRDEPDQPLQLFVGMLAVTALAFVRTARLIRSEGGARRELEAARDTALEASLAKSLFLANMSHEIRTPLTTVLAAGEILEDTSLDDVQFQLVTKMHRSGDRRKTLVEGILDFSRIEAGELELSARRFDLHQMVADVAEPYALRALETGIGFQCDLDPRVPEVVVADPDRLFQVLNNLLDNALKFTHHGRVSLDVRPAEVDEQGGGAEEAVEFVVQDSGIGIHEADLESVFESFRQVDGTMTRRYGGNGLGLAICKELVELMGGTITLQSRFDAGSTFVVRVPLTPADAVRRETPPTNPVPLSI